ncbi:hypothetical protein MKEN_00715500 [Mycena kentingensis (nom. inval.)]|nr:hypothetical protein MKEN_00715500 [Mycena kentingensis (nom. inval.)]
MKTLLEVLESQLNVDLDTMDPAVAKALSFKAHDMTSNQFIVFERMQAPENRELVLRVAKECGKEGWEAAADRISAHLCAANIDNIQGRVLLQTSMFQAYDTQKVVDHARRYAAELERVGISKDRLCIKIPATGPALNAAPILVKEGIRTLGTSLFSVAQAIACSQAGCLYISPYYNEINAHSNRTIWPESDDPALLHTSSPRLIQVRAVYQKLAEQSGKQQPMIKAASFISVAEAMACGEMQVHSATLPAQILLDLARMPAVSSVSARIPGIAKVLPSAAATYFDTRPLPERLVASLKIDPLIPSWDGVLASTEADYLANNGEKLEEAIENDPVTKQRIGDALALFQDVEEKMKKFIEGAIAEVSA